MSPSQVRRRGATLTLALALGLLTACGGSSNDSSNADSTPAADTASSSAADTSASGGDSGAAATSEIAVTEADFSIALDSGTDLTAGEYTINVTNTGKGTHDLAIELDGAQVAKSDSIAPGESATLTVALDPGQYVFYCSIGNHRAMGMEMDVLVS
jgi:plastocyanin